MVYVAGSAVLVVEGTSARDERAESPLVDGVVKPSVDVPAWFSRHLAVV